jgi:hypothetical protein
MLIIRLAEVLTTRWVEVLAPIGMGATRIVKVKSQKKEGGERTVVRYRRRVDSTPPFPHPSYEVDDDLPLHGGKR